MDKANLKEYLITYPLQNFFKLVTFAALIIGIIISANYFSQINYWPQIGMGDFFPFLLRISFSGFLVFLFLLVLWFGYGVIFYLIVKNNRKHPGIFKTNNNEFVLTSLLIWYYLPSTIWLFLLGTYLYFDIKSFAGLLLVLVFVVTIFSLIYFIANGRNLQKLKLYPLLLSSSFFYSLFLIAISSGSDFYRSPNYSKLGQISALISLTLVTVFYSTLFSVLKNDKKLSRIFTAIFLGIYILILAFSNSISATAFNWSGLANQRSASYILNKEGAELLNAQGIKMTKIDDSFWKIDNVRIQFDDGTVRRYAYFDTTSGETKYFNVPTRDVLIPD